MSFFTAKNIGCFRDTGRRAISPLEGRSRLLKGSYRRRKYAIRKCALAAQKRGFRVFAVQHGGWCAASRTGHLTYRRYGRSNRCRNGKGGPWANDVYVLRGQRKHYLRLFKRILMVLNGNDIWKQELFRDIVLSVPFNLRNVHLFIFYAHQ